VSDLPGRAQAPLTPHRIGLVGSITTANCPIDLPTADSNVSGPGIDWIGNQELKRGSPPDDRLVPRRRGYSGGFQNGELASPFT
jgi:hypothetical protein